MDQQIDSRFSFKDAIFEEIQELENIQRQEQQFQIGKRENHRWPMVPTGNQQIKIQEQQVHNQWNHQKQQLFQNPVSLRNQGQTDRSQLNGKIEQKRNEKNKENEFGGQYIVENDIIKRGEGDITPQEIQRRAREKLAADLLALEKLKQEELNKGQRFQNTKQQSDQGRFAVEQERTQNKGVYEQNINYKGTDQHFNIVFNEKEVNQLDQMDRNKRGNQSTLRLQERHNQQVIEDKKLYQLKKYEGERVEQVRDERQFDDSKEKRNNDSSNEYPKILRDEFYQGKQMKNFNQINREKNFKVEQESSPYKRDVFLNQKEINSQSYVQDQQHQGNTKLNDIDLLQKEYSGRDLDVLEQELLEREHLHRQLNRKEQVWQKRQNQKDLLDKEIYKQEREKMQSNNLADIEVKDKNRSKEDTELQQLRIKQQQIEDKIMAKEKEEKILLQKRQYYENQKERDEQDMIKSITEKEKSIQNDAINKSNKQDKSNDRHYNQDNQQQQREKYGNQMKERCYQDEKVKTKAILENSRRDSQEKNNYALNQHQDKKYYEKDRFVRKEELNLSPSSNDPNELLTSPWKKKPLQIGDNQKEKKNRPPIPILSSQIRSEDNRNVLINLRQSQQQEKKDQSYSSRELNKTVLRKIVSANEASRGNYDSYHFGALLSSIRMSNNNLGNELWRLLQFSADGNCGQKDLHNNVESSFVYSVLSILLDMQGFDQDSAGRVIQGICSSEYSKHIDDFKVVLSFDEAKQRNRIMDTQTIVKGFRRSIPESQEVYYLQGLFRDISENRGAVSERGSILRKDSSPLRSTNKLNIVTPQKYNNKNQEEEYLDCDISSEKRTISSECKKIIPKNDQNQQNKEKKQIVSNEENVFFRLFKEASMKSLRNAEQLSKLQQNIREKEEADLKKECTFKPQINKNSLKIVQRSKSQSKLSQTQISPMRQAIQTIDETRQVRQVEGFNNSQILKRNQSANKMHAELHKTNEKPFLYVDVSISKGKSGKLSIYAGQDPDNVAEQFAQTHGLPILTKKRLARKLSNLIASFENKQNLELNL